MNEEEKEWMFMCMMENIRCKTLYLLSKNILHPAIYANHILENHKQHIFEALKDYNSSAILQQNYQSLIELLLQTALHK